AEGLIACHRIWKCVGVMVDSPEQARLARQACEQAIRQARADLHAMPDDSPAFQGDGVASKANWLAWLDWVERQLESTSPASQ
ncbi:MAG: hypothetical protein NZO58_00755, partial [Gemmataceae bacterium]|nr:hypothetical protein [Gemmataceae bacterium]